MKKCPLRYAKFLISVGGLPVSAMIGKQSKNFTTAKIFKKVCETLFVTVTILSLNFLLIWQTVQRCIVQCDADCKWLQPGSGRAFFFGVRIWLGMTFNYPVLWVMVKGQG